MLLRLRLLMITLGSGAALLVVLCPLAFFRWQG